MISQFNSSIPWQSKEEAAPYLPTFSQQLRDGPPNRQSWGGCQQGPAPHPGLPVSTVTVPPARGISGGSGPAGASILGGTALLQGHTHPQQWGEDVSFDAPQLRACRRLFLSISMVWMACSKIRAMVRIVQKIPNKNWSKISLTQSWNKTIYGTSPSPETDWAVWNGKGNEP